jgi:hypothetical protein
MLDCGVRFVKPGSFNVRMHIRSTQSVSCPADRSAAALWREARHRMPTIPSAAHELMGIASTNLAVNRMHSAVMMLVHTH